MKKPPQFILGGKPHKYIRSKTKLHGYHMTPEKGKPGIIAICKSTKGLKELDTLIHEMLHACGPFADESWVAQTAEDIAKALWQLGYRKNETSKKPKKARKQSNI